MPEIFKDLKPIDREKSVVFCKNCTMSNQRPRMTFNKKGICSSCVFHEYKTTIVDWDKREKELEELCDNFRKEDGTWDVVVPASGGKDSSYVASMLKKKFGMHPVTITFAPNEPTNIGRENLFNSVQSGIDNITISANGQTHRKLVKSCTENFGDNFLPFAYGQVNVPLKFAINLDIPFVMYGENGEQEYGGSIENYNSPSINVKLIEDENNVEGLFVPTYASQLGQDNWLPGGLNLKDLNIYLPPKKSAAEQTKLNVVHYSYFENWQPEKNFEYAKEHCGFKANSSRTEGTYTNFASLDDKHDGFHYYLMFIKMGIGRATSDSAHQVRQGIISRDEGVDLVKKYDGEFPNLYLDIFLEYAQMSRVQLDKIFDKFRRSVIWKKDNSEWKLNHQISKL